MFQTCGVMESSTSESQSEECDERSHQSTLSSSQQDSSRRIAAIVSADQEDFT